MHLFPELTVLQFGTLDINGDQFLSRIELRNGRPGGCFGPCALDDYLLYGALMYLLSLFDKLVQLPRRLLHYPDDSDNQ